MMPKHEWSGLNFTVYRDAQVKIRRSRRCPPWGQSGQFQTVRSLAARIIVSKGVSLDVVRGF